MWLDSVQNLCFISIKIWFPVKARLILLWSILGRRNWNWRNWFSHVFRDLSGSDLQDGKVVASSTYVSTSPQRIKSSNACLRHMDNHFFGVAVMWTASCVPLERRASTGIRSSCVEWLDSLFVRCSDFKIKSFLKWGIFRLKDSMGSRFGWSFNYLRLFDPEALFMFWVYFESY